MFRWKTKLRQEIDTKVIKEPKCTLNLDFSQKIRWKAAKYFREKKIYKVKALYFFRVLFIYLVS